MMGWLMANLFLLAMVAVAAGYFWLLGTLVMLMNVHGSAHEMLLTLAAVASLVATYFTIKRLHRFIERRINR